MALFKRRFRSQKHEVSKAVLTPTPVGSETRKLTLPTTTPVAERESQVQPISSDSKGILVSVIIPVYNSMPYLTEMLNSLEGQDLSKGKFEVIAVDDGSTDFGGEILDIYAKRNRNFTVIHQANSGWPGKPRNVGMKHARGKYVFFVDGDDRLGPQALRRMTSFAEEHDVDVLVPKMVGIDGRRSPVKLFERTIKDVPYDFILHTLSPQKMIRKSLLDIHGIRFVEEKVRLEDGLVMVECYSVAKRTSILADYNYYEIRLRSDGQNISTGHIEPKGYVASLSKIAQTVWDYANDDQETSKKRIAGLFRRKGLTFYMGQRFLRLPEREQREWVAHHKVFLERFGLTDVNEFFAQSEARRVSAILEENVPELERMAQREAEAQRPPEVTQISVKQDLVELIVEVPDAGPRPTGALITDRETGEITVGTISFVGSTSSTVVFFDRRAILQNVKRLGNLFLEYQNASVKRIKMGKGCQDTAHAGLRVYATENGFLSIDRRKAQ